MEQDYIDSILNRLPKEYNPFMMQMYGTMGYFSLYDVEVLLYVHEVQLDKFWQELTIATMSVNMAHANHQTCGVRDQHTNSNGKGCVSRGRWRGKGRV